MAARDPEKRRAANARYYTKLKERLSAGEIYSLNYRSRKKYEQGIGRKELTRRALAARLRRQVLKGGEKPDTCQVCNRGGRIVFDHCHASNQFRGWLCHNCNVVLGLVNDDPVILTALLNYICRK